MSHRNRRMIAIYGYVPTPKCNSFVICNPYVSFPPSLSLYNLFILPWCFSTPANCYFKLNLFSFNANFHLAENYIKYFKVAPLTLAFYFFFRFLFSFLQATVPGRHELDTLVQLQKALVEAVSSPRSTYSLRLHLAISSTLTSRKKRSSVNIIIPLCVLFSF